MNKKNKKINFCCRTKKKIWLKFGLISTFLFFPLIAISSKTSDEQEELNNEQQEINKIISEYEGKNLEMNKKGEELNENINEYVVLKKSKAELWGFDTSKLNWQKFKYMYKKTLGKIEIKVKFLRNMKLKSRIPSKRVQVNWLRYSEEFKIKKKFQDAGGEKNNFYILKLILRRKSHINVLKDFEKYVKYGFPPKESDFEVYKINVDSVNKDTKRVQYKVWFWRESTNTYYNDIFIITFTGYKNKNTKENLKEKANSDIAKALEKIENLSKLSKLKLERYSSQIIEKQDCKKLNAESFKKLLGGKNDPPFPTQLFGTKLSYSHDKIFSNGKLRLEIQINKENGDKITTILFIQVIGIDEAKNKRSVLEAINNLKPQDFESIYPQSEKSSKVSSDKSFIKKQEIVELIKNKTNRQNAKSLIDEKIIEIKPSNGKLEILIKREKFGETSPKSIQIIDFKTNFEVANEDITKIKNLFESLDNSQTKLPQAKNIFPSSLKQKTIPKEIGFIDPSKNNQEKVVVSFKVLQTNDEMGNLQVEATFSKIPGDSKKITFTLRGYKSKIKEANKDISKIKNLFESLDNSQTNLPQSENIFPSSLKQKTIPKEIGFIDPSKNNQEKVVVSFKVLQTNDEMGNLQVEATFSKIPGDSKKITFTLRGYKSKIKEANKDISKIKNLFESLDNSQTNLPQSENIFPSSLKQKTIPKEIGFIDPSKNNQEKVVVSFKVLQTNDEMGNLQVEVTLSKIPGDSKKITFTLRGYKSKIKEANKDISKIKNLFESLDNSQTNLPQSENIFPSSLKQKTIPKEIGFIDPSKNNQEKVVVSFKVLQTNDEMGNLQVEATFSKIPGDSKKITFTLRGYKSKIKEANKDISKIKNLFESLDNSQTNLPQSENIFPSSLKQKTIPKEIGFIDPSKSNPEKVVVSFKVLQTNDEMGNLQVKATFSKINGKNQIFTFTLTGYKSKIKEANEDIAKVKKEFEKIKNITRNADSIIDKINLGTELNANILNKLLGEDNKNLFPKKTFKTFGTKLTYSHKGIKEDGKLQINIKIEKKYGQEKIVSFSINFSGITSSLNKENILKVIENLEPQDFESIYPQNEKSSKESSDKSFDKKQDIVNLIKNKTNRQNAKSLIDETIIEIKPSDGKLEILIKREKFGETSPKIIEIKGFITKKQMANKSIRLIQEKIQKIKKLKLKRNSLEDINAVTTKEQRQFNEVSFKKLIDNSETKWKFPKDIYGTTLKYTHNKITKNGPLNITVSISKNPGKTKNVTFSIQIYGINDAKNRKKVLDIIKKLSDKDFVNLYSEEDKQKIVTEKELTNDDKKDMIIKIIKEKINKNDDDNEAKKLIKKEMISFKKGNGEITIEIDKKDIGKQGKKTIKTIKILGFLKIKRIDISNLQIEKIPFIGFNGDGRITRNNPELDPNKGDYQILFNIEKINEHAKNKHFFIEYKVVDKNEEDITWIDANNNKNEGWQKTIEKIKKIENYWGIPPIKLKNDQIIKIRLRSKYGFVFITSELSNPKEYKNISDTIYSKKISGLKKEIIIPNNFRFYDLDNLENEQGEQITYDENMPNIKFFLNGEKKWQFKIENFDNFSQKFNVKVQILRPWRPSSIKNNEIVDEEKKPIYGYQLKINGQEQWKTVYYTELGNKINNRIKIGWVDNINTIENSWFNYEDMIIEVSQSIRFKLVAKQDYAFKWEKEDGKERKDIWVPKKYSNIFYNNDENKIAPLLFKGQIVTPPIYPKEVKINYLPGIDNNEKLSRAYQGFAIINPSKNPSSEEKWIWEFKIETKDSSTSKWTKKPTQKISNGDKIYLRINVKNDQFFLNSNYKRKMKEPAMFTVQGLPNMIKTIYIPRPKIEFKGLVGQGEIKDIIEDKTNLNEKIKYKRGKNNKLPEPIASGKVKKIDIYGGVKWEYQSSINNPILLGEEEIKKIPWSDSPPKNLDVGNYLRIRVAPKSKLDNVEPAKYSYSDMPGGWIEVKNLIVNPQKIDINPKISGYIGRTKLQVALTSKSLDEKGVIIQASIDNENWLNLDAITNLKNNDKVSYRAIVKPNYLIDKKMKNVYVDKDKLLYIQKEKWKNQPISGLISYINVDWIKIKTLKQIRDSRHLDDDKINLKNFLKKHILDGYASIINIDGKKDTKIDSWINNIDSIIDSAKQPASSKIKIEFIVWKFNSELNRYSKSEKYNIPPQGLKNGDKVMIKVIPINKNYKLSKNVTSTMIINGLVIKPPNSQSLPKLIFRGKNNFGTIAVVPIASKGFKWVYSVFKNRKPNINEKIVFSSNPPSELANGDYVIVELRSSIKGNKITQTYRTKPQIVTNLINEINLSYLKIKSSEVMEVKGEVERAAYITSKMPKKIKNSQKLIWKYIVTNSDKSPNEFYEYSVKNPSKLKNGDYVHAMLFSKDSNFKVIGFNPISLKINNLKSPSTLSSKNSLLIASVSSIISIILIILLTFMIIRNRKKKIL